MTRSSLSTGRSWEDDLVLSQDSLESGQSSSVVSKILCQSNDRRGDEVDYHGFVSKIDLRQPMTICAVHMNCLERENRKNDQHCCLNGEQRHALAIILRDIMTTGILIRWI